MHCTNISKVLTQPLCDGKGKWNNCIFCFWPIWNICICCRPICFLLLAIVCIISLCHVWQQVQSNHFPFAMWGAAHICKHALSAIPYYQGNIVYWEGWSLNPSQTLMSTINPFGKQTLNHSLFKLVQNIHRHVTCIQQLKNSEHFAQNCCYRAWPFYNMYWLSQVCSQWQWCKQD